MTGRERERVPWSDKITECSGEGGKRREKEKEKGEKRDEVFLNTFSSTNSCCCCCCNAAILVSNLSIVSSYLFRAAATLPSGVVSSRQSIAEQFTLYT